MSYELGITKCQQALDILSSDEMLETKVDNAFSVVIELNPKDTSLENYKEVVEWCERYASDKGLSINLDGMQKNTDPAAELIKLFWELENLCRRIIEYNTAA